MHNIIHNHIIRPILRPHSIQCLPQFLLPRCRTRKYLQILFELIIDFSKESFELKQFLRQAFRLIISSYALHLVGNKASLWTYREQHLM
jgi:hypothetical protein